MWILYRSQKKLSQETFSCLNLAIETPENGGDYVQS